MEDKDMRLIDRILKLKIKLFGIEMEFIDVMFGMIIMTFALVARLHLYDVDTRMLSAYTYFLSA